MVPAGTRLVTPGVDEGAAVAMGSIGAMISSIFFDLIKKSKCFQLLQPRNFDLK